MIKMFKFCDVFQKVAIYQEEHLEILTSIHKNLVC